MNAEMLLEQLGDDIPSDWPGLNVLSFLGLRREPGAVFVWCSAETGGPELCREPVPLRQTDFGWWPGAGCAAGHSLAKVLDGYAAQVASLTREVDVEGPPLPESDGNRYALKALRSELAMVAIASGAGGGKQLNSSAYALFRFVRAGQLRRDIVERSLIGAALHAGLSKAEAERTIANAAHARRVA